MAREFGGEFLEYLERHNNIGSYCAEDCQYIAWLESEMKKLRTEVGLYKDALVGFGHIECEECKVMTDPCDIDRDGIGRKLCFECRFKAKEGCDG